MSIFRHHPDGLIYVGDLVLPLAFFQQQEPGYTLPTGAIGRKYVPDEQHTLSDGNSQWAGELPWVEGDRYLAQLATYQAAWDAANTPPPTALLPRWGELYDRLHGSDLFAKAYSTTQNNAMSLLLSALDSPTPADSPKRLADFDFAITEIRKGLVEDFTSEQVDRFNALLIDCDFPFLVGDGNLQSNQIRVSSDSQARGH